MVTTIDHPPRITVRDVPGEPVALTIHDGDRALTASMTPRRALEIIADLSAAVRRRLEDEAKGV